MRDGSAALLRGGVVDSFKELLELLLTALNRQRVLIPIPFALTEMQARLFDLCPIRH
jgi:hypothetical protein